MAVQLFLSCVSDEFGVYRDELRRKLTRPNVEIKIQEDFKALGGDTLMKLEAYIDGCEAIVHFVGDMTGSAPPDHCVAELLARRPDLKTRLPPLGAALEAGAAVSYTQWEAWLALYHRKDLVIAASAPGVARDPKFAPTIGSAAAQADHLKRLREVGRYRDVTFADGNDLVAQILASAVIDALAKAAAIPSRQPRALPFASLGPLFMGRERPLEVLRAAFAAGKGAAVTGRALHGLGGVGKTRFAIEYALRREAEYSALLFARADDPATLDANLAALAGAGVLDLDEKDAPQDAVKLEAVLRWLEAHPTWLMILDNVDAPEAVAAVGRLMARLRGGHVIVTARASNFPASLRKLELDVLDEGAAAAFLLERTRDDRTLADDDADKARAIARELGGLALGLEQAGAFIATERIGFADYLRLWSESRQRLVDWFDRTQAEYDHDTGLAATWATSVDRLSPESRGLLDRLAMLAPDRIPDSLLGVAFPGQAADFDAQRARAGLYAYSLVTRARGEDGSAKGFVMHRLVQDFSRRAMTEERSGEALREALGWIAGAFVGDPRDVRSWPVLDPLAPHALAVARRADEAGITEPTGRLFAMLGVLFRAKARFTEAESLDRRAIAIAETCYGPDHHIVAICLNNLASLLQATNRPGEAEPLYRRAMAINEARYGPEHPDVAIYLNNLATLLEATNRLGEAEPLYRRALAIFKTSLGADHPRVATGLNNLANLLRAMNRLDQAELLYRRALAIDEKSLGPDHPEVATDLNNLALLLKDTNRLAEAEPLYRRALVIATTNYGPDHPAVAIGLNNLASLLRHTKGADEAEPLFRRALAIDDRSYGPDHPNVATDLNNLALLLQDTNRLGEAEPLFRRALAIFEQSLGPDHPGVATCISNLAELLREANRPGEAEPLYRRALSIFEMSLGADHPNTVTVRESLAALEAALHAEAGVAKAPAKTFFGRLFARR